MDLQELAMQLLVASGGVIEDEVYALLSMMELKLGLGALGHLLCPHGCQPPLELRLAVVYIQLFKFNLESV